MVKYRGRVVRVEPVYGEGNVIIEAWVTFKVKGYEIETDHVGIPVAPENGKEYIVDFRLMTYDFHPNKHRREDAEADNEISRGG